MSNGISEQDTFLFTSESVGEGHPGEFAQPGKVKGQKY